MRMTCKLKRLRIVACNRLIIRRYIILSESLTKIASWIPNVRESILERNSGTEIVPLTIVARRVLVALPSMLIGSIQYYGSGRCKELAAVLLWVSLGC